jgi:H+/Cl- antiporter ClcA
MLADVERVELPPGLTIAGIVEVVHPDPVLRAHAAVTIGGELVPVERCRNVRPKAGALLAISAVPGNGQTALCAVLVVAIAVAAVYTGGAAAGLFAPGSTAGLLAGAAASAAIPAAGPLAVNAPSPPAAAVPA